MMDVLGETRGVELVEATDERDWIAPGGEGFSEIGGVCVEVIRVVTNEMPSSGISYLSTLCRPDHANHAV